MHEIVTRAPLTLEEQIRPRGARGTRSERDLGRPRAARDRRGDALRREPAAGAHRHRRVHDCNVPLVEARVGLRRRLGERRARARPASSSARRRSSGMRRSPTCTPPVAHAHDRWGFRLDEVEYDPSYHRVLSEAVARGAHTSAWADPRAGSRRRAGGDVHAVRAGRAGSRVPGVDDARGRRLDQGLALGRRRVAAPACTRASTSRVCSRTRRSPAR